METRRPAASSVRRFIGTFAGSDSDGIGRKVLFIVKSMQDSCQAVHSGLSRPNHWHSEASALASTVTWLENARHLAVERPRPRVTAKGRVWPMLMAPAEEAGGYVQNTKEEAAAEASVGASGSGAIQSSSPEQPYVKKRPTNVRPGHHRFCRVVLLRTTTFFQSNRCSPLPNLSGTEALCADDDQLAACGRTPSRLQSGGFWPAQSGTGRRNSTRERRAPDWRSPWKLADSGTGTTTAVECRKRLTAG